MTAVTVAPWQRGLQVASPTMMQNDYKRAFPFWVQLVAKWL